MLQINSSACLQAVSIEELLSDERPLLANLRWLQLLLDQDAEVQRALKKLCEVRMARARKDRDLELPYHPIALAILQVAF